MNRSKAKLDFNNLAETLRSSLENYCDDATERHIGVEEFLLEYLNLGISPTQAQVTLLKAFYGEPLTVEQQSILECWQSEGRTNWKPEERYQNLILEAGRRSGKCLVGSSLVLTHRGWEQLSEIGATKENPKPGDSWEVDRQVCLPAEWGGMHQASYFYYLGKSDTLLVETKKGYRIEGTAEHRVWCRQPDGTVGWKRLGELAVNDEIALWLQGDWQGEEIDKEEAYLLGAFCSSKYNHFQKELRFECQARDLSYFKKLAAKRGYTFQSLLGDSRQKRHLLMPKSVRDYYYSLGLDYWEPDKTEVPKTIRLGTKASQRAFLTGLFDAADGTGYSIISRSRLLLAQVQVMLLPFGIISQIKPWFFPKRKEAYYLLEIVGVESVAAALHELVLSSPTKGLNVQELKKKLEGKDLKYESQFYWEPVAALQLGQAVCVDLHVPGVERYVAQGMVNHNTSLCASVIGAYEFFKLARLKSPQEFYGIATISTISILCLATQATQGQRTIFGGVKAVIQECKYFKRLIEAQEVHILDEEIRYPKKRLAIYAGTSKSGSQVGGTLKALIMDEIARFENESGVANALELWSNLGASTVTFGEAAVKVAISSAWCQGDAIQVLREKAEFTPRCLSFSLRSWDLNPVKAGRDNPIVMAAYAEDPIKAALEFENIRPAVGDSFIPLWEIEQIPKRCAAVKIEPATVTLNGTTYHTVKVREGTPQFCNTILHIDPSIGKDGYGLAFGHSEFNEDGLQVVVIDGLALWRRTAEHSIYLADVEAVILKIHELRNIVKVSGDHYGSGAETLQRLSQRGLRSEVLYFSNRTQVEMYELLRQLIHQRRLVLPGDSYWTGLLIRELSRIQLIRGMKIDHPKGTDESKDLADAVAAVAWQLAKRAHIDSLNYIHAENTTQEGIELKPDTTPMYSERQLRRQRYLSTRSRNQRSLL